jgi:RimJ/RimL family protein N-acetyltransferase
MPDQLVPLTTVQAARLRSWFLPDRPGPQVGLHVLHTGRGEFFVDRWPRPRVVLVHAGLDYALVGDPAALTPVQLRLHVERGALEAATPFDSVVRAAFPALEVWPRVIFERPAGPLPAVAVPDAQLRRLERADARGLSELAPELRWIAAPWGGPLGLATSDYAWGAFADGRLVAVACSFHVGARYEDIGVVTEAAYRRRGLSTACTAALCGDIEGRDRRPSWSTSLDNLASQGVAQKLGFRLDRHDRLLLPLPWR